MKKGLRKKNLYMHFCWNVIYCNNGQHETYQIECTSRSLNIYILVQDILSSSQRLVYQSQHSSELSCVGAFAATVGLPCHITLAYDALRRVGAVSRLIATPSVSEDIGLPTVSSAFGKHW